MKTAAEISLNENKYKWNLFTDEKTHVHMRTDQNGTCLHMKTHEICYKMELVFVTKHIT